MAKIFVSYSRKDSAAAKKIILALKDIGQDVWVDWEDIPPASDWMDQIKSGIENVEAFIFLISPDSAKSGYCTDEINHAENNKKRIIPVVIRYVKPEDTVDIIRKLNWTFLREEDIFEEGIAKIKTAIELDFEWVEEHNRLQARALEWHRKKDPSLLLRGRDLRNARNLVMTASKKDPVPTTLQQTYIHTSTIDERNRTILWTATIIAVLVMAFLSYAAVTQSKLANKKAIEASQQRAVAEKSAAQAIESERDARRAQKDAEKAKDQAVQAREEALLSKNTASAQRSVARAQIYQFRPGELYTSTLLAIASWQTNQSPEAEEILRANISLLPLPVKQMTHAGRINSIEFNAKGDLFVTAGADGTVCVWQVTNGKKVYCADSPGSVNDAVFSPVEDLVVTGDSTGVVQIMDVNAKTVSSPINIGSPIRDVEIDKKGKSVAITSDDGRIKIFDLRTPQKAGTNLNAADIRFAKFNSTSLQIATGSKDGVVSIWNLNQTNSIITTRKHKGEILALGFSPNNQYLISGGADGAAVVMDPKTGAELSRCRHNDKIKGIAFDPKSNWFVTVSNDRTVRVWDIHNCEQLLIMSQSNFVQAVTVSANGQWIATTGDDKTVRIWSTVNGAELFQIPLKGKGTTLGLTKDGKYLIAGDQNGNIYIWDITAIPAPANSLQFNGVTTSAIYSLAGNRIAASDDRRIWLLSPAALPTLTTTPPGSPIGELLANINEVVLSANGARLGALTVTNDVVIYNTQSTSGKTIRPENGARAFVFSPDGRQVLIGDAAGGVQIWNAVTGQYVNTPVTYKQRITTMATTAELLAIGAGNDIHILNINTLEELALLTSYGDQEQLVFSPDGTWLASSNSTGQIQIWKQENGKFSEPRSFTIANVSSIAFHPKSNLLAIGAVDIVYLIDPVTLKEYARIPHTGTVSSVSFSPDGATLMTTSLKVLQFWDLAKIPELKEENLVVTACGRLTENFSEAQWKALFETEEYKLLCPTLQPAP
ncbi:MAG: TIR domain-containing protein [Chloroflexota bacterium]